MSLLRNRARPLQTLLSCTCIATRLTVSHTDGETEAGCKLGYSLGYIYLKVLRCEHMGGKPQEQVGATHQTPLWSFSS